MQRLNNKFIEKLNCTNEKIYWDSAIKGFGIRVAATGRKSFIINWRNICKLASLEDARVHDLRHTYASLLINRGISLSVIGKLLGHANASTTERYAHLNDETLRTASNIIKFK